MLTSSIVKTKQPVTYSVIATSMLSLPCRILFSTVSTILENEVNKMRRILKHLTIFLNALISPRNLVLR